VNVEFLKDMRKSSVRFKIVTLYNVITNVKIFSNIYLIILVGGKITPASKIRFKGKFQHEK
jgi:hypothetical protein